MSKNLQNLHVKAMCASMKAYEAGSVQDKKNSTKEHLRGFSVCFCGAFPKREINCRMFFRAVCLPFLILLLWMRHLSFCHLG